jgi:hypothetical protein
MLLRTLLFASALLGTATLWAGSLGKGPVTPPPATALFAEPDQLAPAMRDLDAAEAAILAGQPVPASAINVRTGSAQVLGDLPANIPAFWWGCCLGILGVAIVYFATDKDAEQTKKSLYGLLVSCGSALLFYLAIVLVWGVAFFSFGP